VARHLTVLASYQVLAKLVTLCVVAKSLFVGTGEELGGVFLSGLLTEADCDDVVLD